MKKRHDKILSLLGDDAEFDGILRFRGTTRIDGHFRGEILGTGNLIVGGKALVEATIRVSHVLVIGEIRGDVIAERGVDVLSTGKVHGNIQAPTFVMEEGATFDGNCKMTEIAAEEGQESPIESRKENGGETSPEEHSGTIHGYVLGIPSDSPVLSNPSKDQTQEDSGKVPIRDAKVLAKCKGSGKRQAKTDSSGYYRLTDLGDGKWKLKVKAKGYEKAEATVRVNGGGVYELNFD